MCESLKVISRSLVMVKYVNIPLPKPLYDKLTKCLDGSGYRSATEYIIYLIRKNLPDLESKEVEKRLRALGYLS
jgi:hypothetical protein